MMTPTTKLRKMYPNMVIMGLMPLRAAVRLEPFGRAVRITVHTSIRLPLTHTPRCRATAGDDEDPA